MPEHAVGAPSSPAHSDTTPATCGAEALVPVPTWVSPCGAADRMQTPGAAIVCATSSGRVAQADDEYGKSSFSPVTPEQLTGPDRPPGRPSPSEMAVTASTSG